MKNLLLLTLLLATLSACTAYHGEKAALPERNGIVAGETITVKSGENVYVIAHQHNVSMRELIVLNDLKPPYEIKTGQSLTLPATGASFAGDVKAPVPAPRDTVDKVPLAPITPAAVTSQPLAAPVAITPVAAPPAAAPAPSAMPTGAPVSLTPPASQFSMLQSSALPKTPDGQAVVAQSVVAQEPVKALNQPAPQQKSVATTASVTATATATSAVASTPATATAAVAEETASSINLKWPVQGPVLSKFGTKGDGLTNDGINIGAPKGAPVVAAAPGTVVYAGNEMKGFGNLVLIRHHGDWVTAYAHLDRVLVKKDSVVVQGDEIGTVGKTGNVPSPQLHFEVRQGGKPVDPSGYIKNNG